ncbi:MAG: hypothetical protein IGQ88_10120 [Gloeomargaritaceae cyanobacterium C42_A2020_066]|nr:hypothetical protein [Gloeomargaritaceae cyanobacterium C42_A2020_066]
MQSPEPVTLEQVGATLKEAVAQLRSIATRLDNLEQDQREMTIRLEALQKGSEGVTEMAKTIIITAGVAVIFAPLLKELAPALSALLTGNP